MKKCTLLLLALLVAGSTLAQLTGTKSIPGDYATIAAAVTALNGSGTAAPGVTFNVAAGHTETSANILLTTNTGSATAPIVFQKSGGGANPLITAAAGTSTTLDGIVKIQGTDYVTFNGIDITDPATNTTTTTRMEWGYAILVASQTDASQNITIINCTVTLQKAYSASPYSRGIYSNTHTAASTTSITPTNATGVVSNCQIDNCAITNVYQGIYWYGSSSATYYGQNNFFGVITGNTITNFGGGGATVYGMYFIYQTNLKIANNTVNGGSGTTTTLYGIFTTTATNSNVDIYGNTVTLQSSATTSTIYGIQNAMGGTGTSNTVNIYNNTVENCTYTTATSGAWYLLYQSASAFTVNMYGNTVKNNSKPGTGAAYLLYNSNTGANGAINMYNNSVYNNTNTGSATLYGLYSAEVTSTTKSVYGNSCYANSSAGGVVYGLYSTSGNVATIYKNSLYNLTSTGTGGTVNGIQIAGGTAVQVYNNYISDLKTPDATAMVALNGLYISAGTTVNAYYNTIYLNASSTSATTFGSSGIYKSSTVTSELRDNLVDNVSTPGPTGGLTVAYRWNAVYNSTYYTATSNNNCLYAGTPATNKLIFYDGTNSCQTIAEYKALVTGRDVNSFSENPPFVNVATPPYDLHINTAVQTQCESGGSRVTSPIAITDDFDGNLRWGETGYSGGGTAPDVGADEFTGTPMPLMTFSQATTTQVTGFAYAGSSDQQIIRIDIQTTGTSSPLTLTQVTVNANGTTDISNINAAPSKVYYTGGNPTFTSPTLFGSATPTIANYTVSGTQNLVEGWNYFWLAYDIVAGATSGNVIDGECHNVKVTGVDHTPTVTAPPGNKTILGPMTGTYNIGTGQVFPNFATITDAVTHLNNRGVSGPVTFNFLDASYSSGETFPITINQITGASGTNTITFKPGAGVNTTISGSSTSSIFKLNGADYVTFDGSNSGGTSRNLTVSNTATSGTTAVYWIASLGAAAGATDNTIKNCNLANGINTTTTSYVIAAGGTTIASTGADNDNLTIQNNSISKAYVGIWAQGNATNAMDNLLITGNSIGSDYSASYLGHDGIIVGYTTGSTITQNTIFNIITPATTPCGLTLSTGTLNTTVSRNNINNMTYTGTGGYGGRGLYVSTGSATSNLNINNNVFAVFGGDGYTSFTNSSPVGMYFDGTTGGLNIYYNSVYMSGNVTRSAATLTAGILFYTSTITSIDLRNNVFQNSMNNPNNTSAKNYAIYSATANTNFTTINYNDYYVSGTQGVLGYIGSADVTSLGAWQIATTQDVNSISGDPLFNSTTNLTPYSGSPVLAAGTPIPGILNDILGTLRSGTNPSMGAYENGGDVTGPAISYSLLADLCADAAQTVTATITDPSGIPTSGPGLPVLYYKVNAAPLWSSQQGLSIGSNQYSFTINPGLTPGDVVSYFVVAQDGAGTPNMAANPSTGATGFTANPPACSTPPTTPNTYQLKPTLSGNKTVGTGGDYATVADAISALNTACLGPGGVTFNVLAGHTETLPSTTAGTITTQYGSVTTPVMFQKSGAGANPLITAALITAPTVYDGMIKFAGCDYISFDRIDLQENPANASPNLTDWGYAILKESGTNGSQNNTISNCVITLNKTNTSSVGIYSGNHTATSTTGLTVTSTAGANSNEKVYGNTISNTYSGISFTGFNDGSAPYAYYDQNNEIGKDGANLISNIGGTTTTTYGIYTIYQNNLTVANNAFTGTVSGNGTLYGIYNGTGVNSTIDIYGNTVSFTNTGTTAAFYGIYNSGGASGTANTLSIYNNSINGNTYSTATTGSFYGIYNTSGSTNLLLNGNTVNGNTLGSATTAGTGSFYLIYSAGNASTPGTYNAYGNTLNNNTRVQSAVSTGTNYGFYISGLGELNFYGNNLSNFTTASTSTSYILYNLFSGTTKNVYNNTVSNILNANGTIYGLYNGNGTNGYFHGNTFRNINSVATGSIVEGIRQNSGTNMYYYNNFISELYTPNATGTNGCIGINIANTTSGNVIGLYYNTIYLDATSTGGAFGSSAIYASTTPTVDLRNNIVVNKSTPGATGRSVAYWRSSTTLTTYASTSNNNLFYAGTPGTSNLIFYDGTNSDQTLAEFKSRVSPRDASSVTENPPFLNTVTSPYDLHLSTLIATQCESGGATVASPFAITGDYRNVNPRYPNTGYPDNVLSPATAPDIGAHEFGGLFLDLSPPVISYTPLMNTSSTGNRVLTTTITDPSGVPTAGVGLPALYWKVNAGSYTYVQGQWVAGNTYTFTFGSGVVIGDVISYYVVAQDNATTPNVGCYPSAGAGGFTPNPPAAGTPPTNPSTYTIVGTICGNFTVGSGGSYPTLTAAVADFNNKEMTCAVTFLLTDATYPTETFPVVINPNPGSSATNTLTIKPNTGVTAAISGASAANQLLRILNSNTIIDGSNSGGTDRSLTFENTSATTPQVVLIGSSGTTPITDVTLKNCVVINGINSSSAVIVSDGTTAGSAGYFTDITIQNNNISKAYIGVYNNAVVTPGNGNGLLLTGNEFSGTGTNSVAGTALYAQGIDGVTITNNTVSNNTHSTYSTNPGGIWLATGTQNATVTGNTINNISYTGSSSYASRGITVSTNVTGSNIGISDNVISGLSSSGTGTTTGIYIFSGTSGVTVQKNRVSNIKNTNTTGYGANGIYLSSTVTGANINVYNNLVYDIAGYGYNGFDVTDNGYGIIVTSGSGYNIYFNSVHMNTDQNVTGLPAAFNVASAVTGAGAIDLRNNIFSNSQTIGTERYAIYSGTAGTVFSDIDHNDYYTTGPNLGYIGSNRTDLASWQAGTGKDGNSASVNPSFVSGTDLHPIQPLLKGEGEAIPGIFTDFDGITRGSPPDIGAYEMPAVVTGGYILSGTGATLNGSITANNQSCASSFDWGTTTAYGNTVAATPTPVTGTVLTPISAGITGLTLNTTYHYRAVGTVGTTPFPGADNSFLWCPNPDAAGTITGTTTLCQSTSGVSYSVPSITNATTYVWSVPAGATIASGSGTNAITVDFGPSAISGNVSVHGSNVCGDGASSSLAVTVNPQPVPGITGDATACYNTTGHVYSTETGMTNYVWSVSAGGTITAGGSATDATVTVTWHTAGAQTVSVSYTNSNNCTAATPTVYNVTVYPDFTVGSISANQTICYNTTPAQLNGVAPTGGNTPYTYQWQSSTDNITFADVGGATGLNYAPGALTQTTYYRLNQTSASGCGTLATNTVTITVYPQFVVGSIAADQSICYNTTPAQLTGTAPTGGSTPYSYQWQNSTDNVTFADISGETSLNYSPGALLQTTYFRLNQTSASSCGTLTTNTVTITVYPDFVVGSISADQSICYNTTPAQLTGVAPTGGNTPYGYQWQSSTDNITFADIGGATSLNYTPGALTQTTYYRLNQTSASGCGSGTTNTVTITVYPQFIAGSISANQSICYNTTPSQLTGVAPTGGNTPYAYQWQSSTDNITFADVGGATGLNYAPGALTQTTYYRLNQTSASGCGTLTTNTVTITVYPDFVVGSISADQIICYNTTPAQLTGVAPTGGNTPYGYQWQSSTDNITFADIGGATSLNYTPGALTQTTYYRLNQTSASGCGSGTTNTVTITVYPQFVAGSISANQSICYNTAPAQLTGVAPTGGNTPYTYQWQSSTDNITFADIGGATGLNYTPGALTQTTYYRLNQTSASGCGTLTTNTVTITVYPDFVVGSISADQSICYNTTPAQLTGVAPTGGNTPYTYQWQSSTDNITFADIGGATGLNYTPGALTQTTYYKLKQTSASGCGTLTTNTVTITVYPDFSTGSISADQIICYNTTPAQLTGVAPTGGNTPYGYQWQSSTDNITFADIGGATSLNHTPGALTQTTYYRLNQTSASGCGSGTTNTVTITVYPQFVAGSISANQSICYNTAPAQLTGVAPTGGNTPYAYQWQSSTDNITFADVGGATGLNYAPGALTQTTYYRLNQTSASGCGTLTTNTITITVNPLPVPVITGPAIVCPGVSGFLYTTATGMSGYLWTISAGGTIDLGQGTNQISVSWNTPGAQYVTVTYTDGNGCNPATPTTYNVTVNATINPTITGLGVVCEGTTGVIYTTDPGNTGYSWTISAGGTITAGATSQTATVTWHTAGGQSISVTYVDPNGCAVSPTTKLVTVNALPVPTLSGPTPVCYGSTGNVYTTESGMTGYAWSVSPGGTITAGGGSANSTVTVTWSGSGAQSVSVNYTNGNGCTAVSPTAYPVTVYPQLVAGTISGNQSICYNTIPNLLTGTAPTGGNTPYTYQWQSSPDNITFANITGATALTYQPGALTSTTYYRLNQTSASGCGTVTTNTVTITVYGNLVPGTIAANQNICYNTIPALLTGTAPTGGNTPYAFQWQSSPDNITFTDISGATALTYQPGALTSTTYYRMNQTSASGCGTVTTNTVTITVYGNLVPGTIAASQAICYNTIPALLTGTAPTGGNTPYTYQWQSSPDNVTFTNIAGATALTYQPGALTATTYYRLNQTSASGCGTVTTNTVTITVYGNLVPGTIAASQTICYNTIPALLTGTAPTGGNTPYTYQWQSSPDNITFANITGATALTYQPGALTSTTYYRLNQTSASGCGTVTTNTVTITVYGNFVAGTIAASQSICYNTIPALLTGTAPTGGNTPYTYQWQNSPNGVTWTNIAGATALNYQPPALISTTYYRLNQTSASGCGTVTTNTVTITVYGNLVPGTIAANQTICYNTIPALLTGTAPTGGNTPYTYQWQNSPNGVTWTNIAGATALNYQPPALTSTTYYRLNQTSASGCGTVTTNTVTITVYGNLVAGTIAANQSICYNTVPAQLTGTPPTGGNTPYTYQWQNSPNGVTWTNIAGATALNYQPPALTATTYYRLNQTSASGCGTVTTNTVTITVYGNLVAGTIAANQSICYNAVPAQLTGTPPTGGNTPYTYQWQNSPNGVTWTNIAGATALNYQPPALIATTYYRLNQTSASGCGTVTTNTVTITVVPLPTPTITGPNNVCAQTSGHVYTTQAGMTNYVWTVSAGGTITAGGTSTSNTVTVTWNTTGAQTVSVNYTNAGGCTAASATVYNVTVNPLPAPSINGNTNPCVSPQYVDYYTEAGMNNYQWTVSAGGSIYSGQGTYHLRVIWNTAGVESLGINYTNAGGCSLPAPYTVMVFVNGLPAPAGAITGTSPVCAGATGVAYSTTPIQDATSYTWTVPPGATIASGTGTTSITVDFGANATSGNVTVAGTNQCGNGTPSTFAVTVNPLPAAAGTITGSSTVCQGAQGVSYSVATIQYATGYVWTLPPGATIASGANTRNITVNFSLTATSGMITVHGTNACGSGANSPDFPVTVNPKPPTPVITEDGLTLTSTASQGNQWYLNGVAIPGATGQTYEATQSGDYYVIVTINGCSSDPSNVITIVMPGIQEPTAITLRVFPVPNEGIFTLSCTWDQDEILTLEVYTHLGVKIHESKLFPVHGKAEKTVDLRPAPNGVYTVVLRSSDNRLIRKILVNK